MKILCFGSCNIDMVYAVDHILRPGETMAADALQMFPGGKGLNQAIALARAGASVEFAGCIGPDGQFLRDTLTECGVDLRHLRTVEEKTGHAIIQVDKGAENAILIFAGANGMVTKAQIEETLADFSAGDFLLVQNEINLLPELVQAAAKIGMQIVFNPSPLNAQARAVDLQHVQYLLVNETEARDITGSDEPSTLQTYIRQNAPHLKIVLTRGKQGSIYFDAERTYVQQAFKVKSVDTTAAGDTYTGYFIAGLSRGDSYQESMMYASAASAIAVSREGAASSVPTRKEVSEKLTSLVLNTGNGSDPKEMVAEFLSAHYADGTLQMLADMLGYSTSHTGVWLKENLGVSFTELVHDKRCDVCAKYLETTKLPISEIIHLVGYKNESFFRKKFTARYGCSPLTYRKRKG